MIGFVVAIVMAAPAPVSSWSDVLAALHASPRWQVAEARVAVAEAGMVGARRLPNTGLEYDALVQVAGVNPGNETMHEVTITQPFMIGGQRGARTRAVKRAVASARGEAALDRKALVGEARAAWIELVAAQQRHALADAGVRTAQALADIVAARAAAGHASAFDVDRAETVVAEIASEREQARAAMVEAQNALQVIVEVPLAFVDARLELPSALPAAAGETPEVVFARAEHERARADIDVAKAERWPDLSIEVGTVQGTGPYSGAVSFGAEIQLPWFDFGEGPIAEAEARTRAAAQVAEVTRRVSEARIAAARADFERRGALLAAYERDILARVEALAQRGATAYAEGRITLFERLDAERDLLDARFQASELRVDVLTAEARYRDAAGLD